MQPVCEVTCPHCFQVFSIPGPSLQEIPTCWDYDCEVCCRPMKIAFEENPPGEIEVQVFDDEV